MSLEVLLTDALSAWRKNWQEVKSCNCRSCKLARAYDKYLKSKVEE